MLRTLTLAVVLTLPSAGALHLRSEPLVDLALAPAMPTTCASPNAPQSRSLVGYLRAMLTQPRFHYLAPKFGLNVADSASIRMITDPAECERAAKAFICVRRATMPTTVYVAAVGQARWVEDPETKAGEYIAGVVFTAAYDSVLALPGR